MKKILVLFCLLLFAMNGFAIATTDDHNAGTQTTDANVHLTCNTTGGGTCYATYYQIDGNSPIPIYPYLWIAQQTDSGTGVDLITRINPINNTADINVGVGGNVTAIAIDANGDVWVANSTLKFIQKINHVSNKIDVNIPYPVGVGTSIAIDTNKIIWVGSPTSPYIVSRINPITNTVDVNISVDNAYDIAIDANGGVWVADGSSIKRIDPISNSVTVNISVSSARHIVVDNNLNIWASNNVGGERYVYRIDAITNTLVATVGFNYANLEGLSVDNNQNIWAIQKSGGMLSKIDPKTNTVIDVNAVSASNIGIDANQNVWVVGITKVERYDPKTDRRITILAGLLGSAENSLLGDFTGYHLQNFVLTKGISSANNRIYDINGWKQYNGYNDGNILITTDGNHRINYFSIDVNGTREILNSIWISISKNKTPDVNIWRIDGNSDLNPLMFSYARDGNLTIDFNIHDSDNNSLLIDVNYSSSKLQGTGTVLIKDTNSHMLNLPKNSQMAILPINVRGAGDSAYNGIYPYAGVHNNRPWFQLDALHIIYFDDSDYPLVGPFQGWLIGQAYTYVSYISYERKGNPTVAIYDPTVGIPPAPSVSNDLSFVNVFSWDLNVSPTLIADGNYFILIDVNDGSLTDFNSSDFSTGFQIDNTKPSVSWDGNNNVWQKTDANVHLTCNDGIGTGCQTIQYRLDLGNWQIFDKNILISADGNHRLDFNSTDATGNIGDLNTKYVLIDKTAPSIVSIEPNTNTIITYPNPSFTITASDSNSGVKSCKYSVYKIDQLLYANQTVNAIAGVCIFTLSAIDALAVNQYIMVEWKIISDNVDNNTIDINSATYTYQFGESGGGGGAGGGGGGTSVVEKPVSELKVSLGAIDTYVLFFDFSKNPKQEYVFEVKGDKRLKSCEVIQDNVSAKNQINCRISNETDVIIVYQQTEDKDFLGKNSATIKLEDIDGKFLTIPATFRVVNFAAWIPMKNIGIDNDFVFKVSTSGEIQGIRILPLIIFGIILLIFFKA